MPTPSTSPPLHDTPILGMTARPPVDAPLEYGGTDFWVEYPDGLMDLTRSARLGSGKDDTGVAHLPPVTPSQVEIPVDGGRRVRVVRDQTALVVIDMQNFFLHPDLRAHPTGLACVDPLMRAVPALRNIGAKILWVNWGLTDAELLTIPPALVRGFMKGGRGGFGAEMPGKFGRFLMRGAYNSELYGPLQGMYEAGRDAGTDFWIHKNRMSGLWGYQTALDLFLKEHGIKTLLFAGVNADQCVLGTLIDAYFRGYDCILVRDATATASPTGGLENVYFNAGNAYGFITDSERLVTADTKD